MLIYLKNNLTAEDLLHIRNDGNDTNVMQLNLNADIMKSSPRIVLVNSVDPFTIPNATTTCQAIELNDVSVGTWVYNEVENNFYADGNYTFQNIGWYLLALDGSGAVAPTYIQGYVEIDIPNADSSRFGSYLAQYSWLGNIVTDTALEKTQAEKFKEIADAIRAKKKNTAQIVANNFATEISTIQTKQEPTYTPNADNGTTVSLQFTTSILNADGGNTVTY